MQYALMEAACAILAEEGHPSALSLNSLEQQRLPTLSSEAYHQGESRHPSTRRLGSADGDAEPLQHAGPAAQRTHREHALAQYSTACGGSDAAG